MKLRIELNAFPWKVMPDPKKLAHLPKLREQLKATFAAYGPKPLSAKPTDRWSRVHEFTAPADDPAVEALLNEFDKAVRRFKPRSAAMLTAVLEPKEVARARFLELRTLGDNVDLDAKSEPLNQAPVLCPRCKFPDVSKPPQPLRVSKAALKQQDVFSASTGLIVVRRKVLDLLRAAIAKQVEIGEAVIVDGKGMAVAGDPLFWVRPKAMIGPETLKRSGRTCPTCNRVLERGGLFLDEFVNRRGPGLHDLRDRLEHFGSRRADLAMVGGFSGRIVNSHAYEGNSRFWSWPIAISGGLFSHLKAAGVKGILVTRNRDEVHCYFSAKDEPALDASPRDFGPTAQAPARGLPSVPGKGKAAAGTPGKSAGLPEGLPWDYDEEGYVHFQLTTPEVVVFDPMTGEEDIGGPYRVNSFRKPGVYRMHVAAIRGVDAEGDGDRGDEARGVAIDSATLVFVDNAYAAALQEALDWEQSVTKRGGYDEGYLNALAAKVGTRFNLVTPPPRKFKSDFTGDGTYVIAPARIEAAVQRGKKRMRNRR